MGSTHCRYTRLIPRFLTELIIEGDGVEWINVKEEQLRVSAHHALTTFVRLFVGLLLPGEEVRRAHRKYAENIRTELQLLL